MPCPAVEELMSSLRGSIPFLAGTYREHDGQHLPRLQWRLGNGTLNRHDAGLALDVILFNNVERERILAENLLALFVDFQSEMHWLSAIYRNVHISATGVPGSYTQDTRHYTHIHIDWMRYELYERTGRTSIPWSLEARTRGFGANLSAALVELNRAWENNQLSRIDLMHIPRVIIGPITTG
jgi:hypothetical protein